MRREPATRPTIYTIYSLYILYIYNIYSANYIYSSSWSLERLMVIEQINYTLGNRNYSDFSEITGHYLLTDINSRVPTHHGCQTVISQGFQHPGN